jgi:hypothetical protein
MLGPACNKRMTTPLQCGRESVIGASQRTVSITSASASSAFIGLEAPPEGIMKEFLHQLHVQRWDDHRYYHHSRINQSLHLLSALAFVVAYGLLLVDPALAAILAWCVSMTLRQAGHFFFEPRGWDEVNQASDAFKEDIKVGYNIQRKIVLMSLWLAVPLLLWLSPSALGWIEPAATVEGYVRDVGLGWLALGVSGLVFRVLQLAWQQSWSTGLVWAAKIITDPFHDIYLYHKAPLYLLRGELIDPMTHVKQH